ncbi:CobW family GTP-binding protein [Halalkalibacterium halodurans]|uniref:CobW family GTP-binding protein n=1 Tax=Halalkalibacterium halodurans TaxID=86665 RepID=UPI002AA9BC8A|nr:GTP-binding protein [Halalkalibacterium halodurans]MDY7221514.1 GTP-binding protein [Halalkalibacterium halodurans]MDY7240790.1 GTP-binding protein [Halalkalibacterium halodurans]MED4125600.1 GTP-binding protein [Halalkalibacterium halodurans]MED4164560.1 GTP-binding protein [Halalkalibacterium halodurans]
MVKVPVFILSGFLGSGKTTLLERLLVESEKRKLKSAVLMNEMGKTDTDGQMISGKSHQVEKLLDGCMCCNKKSEVVHCMETLLARKPDILFIELTGVANPEEVVDSLTEPQLINRVYVKKIITLIDAENILAYNSLFESDRELVKTTRRQVEVGDFLIVNKIDLVSDSKKAKIEKFIKRLNSVAKTVFSTYSEVELDSLFNTAPPSIQRNRMRLKTNDHHHYSFSRVKSVTLSFSTQTRKKDIERFLKKWKPRLLRAKGYVHFENGTYLMQQAMKRVQWSRALFHGEPYIVLIGIDLHEHEIKEDWAQLVEKATVG